YGVSTDIIAIALPGTESAAGAAVVRKPAGETVNLLAVGAVVPRKGYDVLIDALGRLVDLDWQLVIAGDCKRDRATAGELATALVRKRFGSRVCMAGAGHQQEMAAPDKEAAVFLLASRVA